MHAHLVATSQRAFDRGTRRSERLLEAIADEFLGKRLAAGLSQDQVASAARLPRSTYSRIETSKRPHASLLEISRIAAVLGLDLVARLYPAGDPLRDAGQIERLERLTSQLGEPLRYRAEAPLPALDGRVESRAWDAIIEGHGLRTAVEVEMRIHDAQALERRLALKRRDDPTDRFVLVLADTRTNQRVLGSHPDLFADLARLRRAAVLAVLRSGQHPPTGIVLL